MTAPAYSFDVFDTCLIRTVANPTDLFLMLAQQLLPEAATSEQVADLARARVVAERSARQASDREEITLVDIYRAFSDLADWEISAETMMQAELDLERESVRPIQLIRQKVQILRRKGGRIIFISDMYLPAAHIRQLLVDHEFITADESLYVSGEVGLTKQSGRLFDYVLEAEGLRPDQLWHYGDNPRSDVIVPRRRGIKTVYFRKSQLNRYEQLVLRAYSGQPGYVSRLAGVSRAVRLQLADDPELNQLVELVTGLIAPLLVSFVAWVMNDATQNGLSRLYFVSRDGQILHMIAQTLSQFQSAPECRYLYGSRQAWLLPAIFKVDPSNLDWLFLHDRTPIHLLDKLGLPVTEVQLTLQKYGFDPGQIDRPLPLESTGQFWRFLTDPAISSQVLQRSAIARRATLAYFDQEGLMLSSDWALVDVGWALRGQRAVRRILQSEDSSREVHGYYLAVSDQRQPQAKAGSYLAYFPPTENDRFDSAGRLLLNNAIVVEHFFLMADHPSVGGYTSSTGKTEVVLHDGTMTEDQKRLIALFQKAVLLYANEMGASGLLTCNHCEFRSIAQPLIKEFFSNPARSEAEIVARVSSAIDQTHADQRRLARPLGILDAIDMIRYAIESKLMRRQFFYSTTYVWLEGSLALSSGFIKLLFFPIVKSLQFKRNNGRLRLLDRISCMISKEKM